jgi:hypothetical protein
MIPVNMAISLIQVAKTHLILIICIQHAPPPSAAKTFYFESVFFLAPLALKKTPIQNNYSLRRSRNALPGHGFLYFPPLSWI